MFISPRYLNKNNKYVIVKKVIVMEKYKAVQDFQNAETTIFGALQEAANRYPTAPAIGFFGRVVSFHGLILDIENTARALLSVGIKAGDAVTFMLPNCPQAVSVFYAINRIGAVANMIHTLSSAEEIAYYLRKANSRYIVVLDSLIEKVQEAAKDFKGIRMICTSITDEMPVILRLAAAIKKHGKGASPTKEKGLYSLKKLKRQRNDCPLPPLQYKKDQAAVIFYSGGSTGLPKGVCLSDYNVNSLGVQVADSVGHRLKPGLKFLSAMPLFHGFGLGVGIHAFICNGVECVLVPQFTLDAYVKTLLKEKTNMLAIVPSMLEAFLRSEAFDGKDLSFLKGVFCGADAAPVELQERMNAFLKAHNCSEMVREGYGLTETVTACVLNPLGGVKPGSIGIPMRETRCRIVKPGTFEDLPTRACGELIVASPSVMLGYLDEPEETAKTIRVENGERWLFTGDMCYVDEEGYLYFVQRIKRMIITNGYNVYPLQVEQIVNSVPGVRSSCAVGVKDRLTGQRVVVCVVPTGDADEVRLRMDIMRECRKRLAQYAVPTGIQILSAFPLTKMGKIDFTRLEKEQNEKERSKNA